MAKRTVVNLHVELSQPLFDARGALRKALEAGVFEDVRWRVIKALAEALGAVETLWLANCAGPNDIAAGLRDADEAVKRARAHIADPGRDASTAGRLNEAETAVVKAYEQLRRCAGERGWREVRSYEWAS